MEEQYNAGNPEHVKRQKKKLKYKQTEEQLALRNLITNSADGQSYISNLLARSKIFEKCNTGNSWGIYNEGWRNFGLEILKGVCEAVPEDVPEWMEDMVRTQLQVKFPGDE